MRPLRFSARRRGAAGVATRNQHAPQSRARKSAFSSLVTYITVLFVAVVALIVLSYFTQNRAASAEAPSPSFYEENTLSRDNGALELPETAPEENQ